MEHAGNPSEITAEQSEYKVNEIVLHYIPDDKLVEYPGEMKPFPPDNTRLEKSIKKNGINQPLVVTTFGQPDGYYLILDGRRRRTVGRSLGMTEFPCVVRKPFESYEKMVEYFALKDILGKLKKRCMKWRKSKLSAGRNSNGIYGQADRH